MCLFLFPFSQHFVHEAYFITSVHLELLSSSQRILGHSQRSRRTLQRVIETSCYLWPSESSGRTGTRGMLASVSRAPLRLLPSQFWNRAFVRVSGNQISSQKFTVDASGLRAVTMERRIVNVI